MIIQGRWILKGCTKCHGDLVSENGDLRCYNCGFYYYNLSEKEKASRDYTRLVNKRESEGGRPGPKSRAAKSVNSRIKSQDKSRPVQEYLKSGRSALEITTLLGVSDRYVRSIRLTLEEEFGPLGRSIPTIGVKEKIDIKV